ncbi:hypothetical protein LC065_20090 (plasmid) [Halobacillus litoralis]|uniref:hypothetical protein n=1 Tax=Halobacillus litoralis TaxID=45668 RepID=UPI001CFECDC4|nr:hypothetical protein [Halobacillus litoralis]WLR49609.1 hypothetical protein LC065_20090 [Halobacillus litoralis]
MSKVEQRTGTDKVVKLQGKEYVLFEGLLEVSHKDYGMTGSKTEIVQLPTEENEQTAVMISTVFAGEKSYTAIGDASPKSVNKMIKPHIIRMAETRALGRAMRLMTGYGTVFEELGDVDFNEDSNKNTKQTKSNKSSGAGKKPAKKKEQQENTPKKATKAQVTKIQKDAKALGLSAQVVYDTLAIEPLDDQGNLEKSDASKAIKFLKSDEAQSLADNGKEESGEATENEVPDVSNEEDPF